MPGFPRHWRLRPFLSLAVSQRAPRRPAEIAAPRTSRRFRRPATGVSLARSGHLAGSHAAPARLPCSRFNPPAAPLVLFAGARSFRELSEILANTGCLYGHHGSGHHFPSANASGVHRLVAASAGSADHWKHSPYPSGSRR
jgi:hypothetical protein